MKRTDDFEGVICDCGEFCICIDKPEYPECAAVWECKKCKKFYVDSQMTGG